MNDRLAPKLCLGALFVMLAISLALVTGVIKLQPTGAEAAARPALAAPTPTFIAWEPSFESAMQRAATANQPVLVDFYTDWCPSCKTMDQTYNSPEVTAIAGHIIAVKVNAEVRTDLAAKYGINSYPTTLVLNTDGGVYTRFSGAVPPSEFANWLRPIFANVLPAA